MKLNDKMTDLDNSFLDSGQLDNKKEDGISKAIIEVPKQRSRKKFKQSDRI